MSDYQQQQQDLEQEELELRAVLSRVETGMSGQSDALFLASSLGLSYPTVNKLGGTDEV